MFYQALRYYACQILGVCFPGGKGKIFVAENGNGDGMRCFNIFIWKIWLICNYGLHKDRVRPISQVKCEVWQTCSEVFLNIGQPAQKLDALKLWVRTKVFSPTWLSKPNAGWTVEIVSLPIRGTNFCSFVVCHNDCVVWKQGETAQDDYILGELHLLEQGLELFPSHIHSAAVKTNNVRWKRLLQERLPFTGH